MRGKEIKGININLAGLSGKLNIQLQHLSDILKFANIAMESASKENFDNYSVFTDFKVANNHILDFVSAKKKFHQWCLRNSFRDSVEAVSSFLEECNFVCELLEAKNKQRIKAKDFNNIFSVNKLRFHRKNFPQKIEHLRTKYNISSLVEDHVLSLNKVRNCLVHRTGAISKEDLNTDNALVAKFREIQIIILSPDKKDSRIIKEPTVVEKGGHVGIRTNDLEKRFKLGEKIDFEPIEHTQTVFTFFAFAIDINKSISKYAKLKTNESTDIKVPLQGVEVDKKTGESEDVKKSSIIKLV